MSNIRPVLLISSVFLLLLGFSIQGDAKILSVCEAVKELRAAGISRSSVRNWVCIMLNESGLNTKLITQANVGSSSSFGIFQIDSRRWCKKGKNGGICKKRCEDFADNNISDDIVCAKKIANQEGFKTWPSWTNKCKNNVLPNVKPCKYLR